LGIEFLAKEVLKLGGDGVNLMSDVEILLLKLCTVKTLGCLLVEHVERGQGRRQHQAQSEQG